MDELVLDFTKTETSEFEDFLLENTNHTREELASMTRGEIQLLWLDYAFGGGVKSR